jgi:hypothetical protein
MPEIYTPGQFSPGFDAQAASIGDKSGIYPKVSPGGINLAYGEGAPESTTYVDVVAAPGAGKKIRVHALIYANRDGAAKQLQVRFGAGAAKFPMGLATTSGNFAVPFPAGSYLEGGDNEALQAGLVTGTAAAAATKAIALYTIENA